MMIRLRQNLFLSIIPEMSHRLRLKPNQILMDLMSMLKLYYMLTLLSSHLMPMKLTRLNFFQAKLNGKIRMTCLIGYIVKQIWQDIGLLYVDPIWSIQCCNCCVKGVAITKCRKKDWSMRQHGQENVGVCSCFMDIWVGKQMIWDYLFLMEFTTMRWNQV